MSNKISERLSLGITAILLVSMFCPGSPAVEPAAVQKAPTIVCLGDSITRAGYPTELEKIVEARVINAGVGGNTSRQGLERLERDVLVHKPDIVITFFGANDSRRDAPKTQVSVEEYYQNLSTIIQRCKQAGAKVILGTLPPIEPEAYYQRHPREAYAGVGGLEKWLEQYRSAALMAAASNNIPGVDLYKVLSKTPGWRKPDGVHPTEEGNRILAEIFAKALRAEMSKAPVSGISGSFGRE